ncbi:MAG: hypothetical protein C4525_16865 [Desulfarculus sp.]|jgi:hypothetical protein|nr:MAG: hypothetical protein C4525_16865 [Desulfarculus sp.]
MKLAYLKQAGPALLAALVLVFSLTGASLAYDRQTDRQAAVNVEVQPSKLAPGQPAVFQLRLSTHSVELSQDLTKVAALSDDAGNQYRPRSWQGSPPGGHHRSGTLTFPPLSSKAARVTLTLRGIGTAAQRSFAWELKK